MTQSLAKREKALKGEYPRIWYLIKHYGTTSLEVAQFGLSVNLPTRCSDLDRMLGVTIRRDPIKLPSGKRCKRYSWRPKGAK